MTNIVQIKTPQTESFVNITNIANEFCIKENRQEGILHIFTQHTTCGLTINENADPSVQSDLLRRLSQFIPVYDKQDRHGEGNSAAHLKSSLLGFSVSVPLIDGQLALGCWQGIYLVEFDGPRTRNIIISVS